MRLASARPPARSPMGYESLDGSPGRGFAAGREAGLLWANGPMPAPRVPRDPGLSSDGTARGHIICLLAQLPGSPGLRGG